MAARCCHSTWPTAPRCAARSTGMKLAQRVMFRTSSGRQPRPRPVPSGSSPSPNSKIRAGRPCLVLLSGLPGTGKSSLARALVEPAGFIVIRSDEVRKELAGRTDHGSAPVAFGEDLYTPVWNERTYAECLRRAEELIFDARRVLIDASFREERCAVFSSTQPTAGESRRA